MSKLEHPINIKVDKKHFQVFVEVMTGLALRQLAGIPDSHEVWLEKPGEAEDLRIEDNQTINLKSGMSFVGYPRSITPGGLKE